jgi:hypothetical protein
LATSTEGKAIYTLHDNGRKLFTTARDCTPMQRFVYVMAKDHHTDDDHKNVDSPGGFDKGQRFQNATQKF